MAFAWALCICKVHIDGTSNLQPAIMHFTLHASKMSYSKIYGHSDTARKLENISPLSFLEIMIGLKFPCRRYSSMGWNMVWISSSDGPVWALPGWSLSSHWTPQSEAIECMHHVQLQEDAGPNVIWFAYMVAQDYFATDWPKNRTSTSHSEMEEPALKLQAIYIPSLCT